MQKTHKEGVYTRTKKNGEIIYYATFRKHGKSHQKNIGSSKDGWTISKAFREREKLRNTKAVVSSRLKLDDAAEAYLLSIAHQSDGKNMRGKYDNHIKPVLGHYKLGEIKISDILELRITIESKVSKKTGRHFAPKTVNDFIDLVNVIYSYHNRFADVEVKSPASKERVKRYKVDNNRMRYLSLEEVAVLYDAIINRKAYSKKPHMITDDVTQSMLMFTRLSLSTGARLNTVMKIQVKDINFEDGVIMLENFKSKRRYIGYLKAELLSDLREWTISLSDNDYIFGKGIEPLNTVTFSKRLQTLIDKVFNEGVTDRRDKTVIHTLRHTFASHLAIQGTSIQVIMKLLDHTTIKQSMVYAKLAPNSGMEEVARLCL